MTKSAMIRARMDPHLKNEVEAILGELGLSTTQALTLFYQQIRLTRGLPFEVRIPNEVTLQTFADTDAGKNIVRAQSAVDLFDKLGL
ncbi:MAG: type II toxin-antitoxin system RelB/DinJ family antitoxin [Caldilineaceae bacterium]